METNDASTNKFSDWLAVLKYIKYNIFVSYWQTSQRNQLRQNDRNKEISYSDQRNFWQRTIALPLENPQPKVPLNEKLPQGLITISGYEVDLSPEKLWHVFIILQVIWPAIHKQMSPDMLYPTRLNALWWWETVIKSTLSYCDWKNWFGNHHWVTKIGIKLVVHTIKEMEENQFLVLENVQRCYAWDNWIVSLPLGCHERHHLNVLFLSTGDNLRFGSQDNWSGKVTKLKFKMSEVYNLKTLYLKRLNYMFKWLAMIYFHQSNW